jgi:hypothetical protein
MNHFTAVLSLFFLLLSAGSGVLLLSRVREGITVWDYAPLLIELSLALLLFGMALLPEGFPSLFSRVIGHPVSANYVHTRASDGVTITETWILVRWWGPIGRVFGVAMFIGLIWSIWNLRRNGARLINASALVLGIFWMTIVLTGSLFSFPL